MKPPFVASSGRQHPAVAMQKFDGAAGIIVAGAVDGIEVPGGSMPLRAFLQIVTPFTPGVTVTVGDLQNVPNAPTLYGTLNLSGAAGRSVIAVPQIIHPVDTKLTFTFSDEPTDGEAYYVLEYVVSGRAHTSFGGPP